MNILLLKPHSSYFTYGNMIPLGLAYVAAVLQEGGHKVRVSDFSLTAEEWERKHGVPFNWERVSNILKKDIGEFQPSLVGITCNTAERFNMIQLAEIVKKFSDSLVVVGGPHVTAIAEQTLSYTNSIDIIVRGEGEATIQELCEKIEGGDDWKRVKGLSFKDGEKIISNSDRELISDLDKIPFPARELFENEKYRFSIPLTGVDNNVTGIVTSRGCPWKCKFCFSCVMWRSKFRYRSAKNVVDEIEDTLNAYPFYDGFWFCDDHFYVYPKRAIEICKEIKTRGLDFIWGCSGRVDGINRELAAEMSSAGCRLISFGIESGSDRVLKLMNKETNPHLIKRAVKICKEHSIQPRGTFIFGYPRENMWDVLKTLKVLYHFEPNSVLYGTNVILYPGTPLTQELLEDFNWYADLPKNMPRIAGIPQYAVKGDPYRKNLIYKLARVTHWMYDLTHPRYIANVLKMRLGAKRPRNKDQLDVYL